MTKMKKWIAYLLICALVFPLTINTEAKAADVKWKVSKINTTSIDRYYPVNFDTDGVIYGYSRGSVALMDGFTGKLIKRTQFNDINEIRKNDTEDTIDAIVGKKVKGTLYYGVIDRDGDTIIPANKYTQIYFMDQGFRAVDSKNKTYLIDRTGQVLYTYGTGEVLKEYVTFFVVYKPIYTEGDNKKSDPACVEIKGTYDYSGNPITEIPESDKTANNQYWLQYNTAITNMKTSVEKEIKENIPKDYTEQIYKGTQIENLGNCYILDTFYSALNKEGKSSMKSCYFIYDRNGNQLAKAEYVNTIGNVAFYQNSRDKKAALLDTITYQKTENTDVTDIYNFGWKFGAYFAFGYIDDDVEGDLYIGGLTLYDANGNLVKAFDSEVVYDGDYIKSSDENGNRVYYNGKLEEFVADGYLRRIGDGNIIVKSPSDDTTKLTFTDSKLNKVTDITLKNIWVVEFIDYQILPGNTGVYVKFASGDGQMEYVIDKNGKIISASDNLKADVKIYMQLRKNTYDIRCVKMAKTVTIGKTYIKSLKNTGNGEATISWNAIPGVTGYNIEYKSDKETYVVNAKTKATTLTLSGLEKGATYSFRVVAYIKHDTYSDFGTYSSRKAVKIQA